MGEEEEVRGSLTDQVETKRICWLRGNERQVGILMSASCFKWSRKHKSVCSQTDVSAAKNNPTLWLNGGAL